MAKLAKCLWCLTRVRTPAPMYKSGKVRQNPTILETETDKKITRAPWPAILTEPVSKN